MFAIPGKAPVTLTDKAVAQLRKLANRGENPVYALRIGVKKGGCAGMEYAMDYAEAAQPGDELIEQDGARVLIAANAMLFMLGSEIDYETGLLESGFKFRNPNVSEACGCGELVKFEIQP